MSELNHTSSDREPDQSRMLLKSTPGDDRPRRQDRTPRTEPNRPLRDDTDERPHQDEAELHGEGGTYDRE
jgi:hypothetical protein